MKKIVGLALALVLLFAMAVPAGALSLIDPKYYNDKVLYAYIDYSQENIPTLFMYGGERGGYGGVRDGYIEYPEFKVYAFDGGKVHRFQPSDDSETRLDVFVMPYGYRNKQTGELKWFAKSGTRSWGGVTVWEVVFDYQNYQYTAAKIAHIDDVLQLPDEWSAGDPVEWVEVDDNYNDWAAAWELEVTGEAYETKPYHNAALVYHLLRNPGPAPQNRLLMHIRYLLYKLFNW